MSPYLRAFALEVEERRLNPPPRVQIRRAPCPCDTDAATDCVLEVDELLMLRRIADGWTRQQVADELHVSLRRVGQRLEEVLFQLCVPNMTAAVALAIRRGWIE